MLLMEGNTDLTISRASMNQMTAFSRDLLFSVTVVTAKGTGLGIAIGSRPELIVFRISADLILVHRI